MRNHVGPYQRPAPPKRPVGLGASKAVQKPVVPMHEIEAQAQVVLQGMIEKVRKAGRPSVHQEPMTAAERQARSRGIQEALRITDATGKSHAEGASGGRGSYELDPVSIFVDEPSQGSRVNPSPAADDRKSHKVHVRGLQIGDEDTNRRLFAEDELSKMIGEYFESPTVNPSAQWVIRHVSRVAIQQQCSPSLTLTCKVCGDVKGSMDDAADHLRIKHRKLICEWFKRLNPPREFRDMGSYVTVAIPKRRKSVQNHAISTAK
jgi:hypothetical protein